MARLWAHVNDPRPVLPDRVGPRARALSTFLARGMAVDPEQRPQSAGDLAHALSAVLEGRTAPEPVGSVATGEAAPFAAALPAVAGGVPAAAAPAMARAGPHVSATRRVPGGAAPPIPAPDGPPSRRGARLAAVAALVLALLTAGTLLAVSDRSPEPQPATPPAAPEDEVALTVEDTPTTVSDGSALIRGRTTPGARVEIDGQPAAVDGDRFVRRVPLEVGENRILVVATGPGLRAARQELVLRRAEPQPTVDPVAEPVPSTPEPEPSETTSSRSDQEELGAACDGGDMQACDDLWTYATPGEPGNNDLTGDQLGSALSCGGEAVSYRARTDTKCADGDYERAEE
jgi:hypothetical protein